MLTKSLFCGSIVWIIRQYALFSRKGEKRLSILGGYYEDLEAFINRVPHPGDADLDVLDDGVLPR